MDIFTATMIAEGAPGFEPDSYDENIEAWQTLIDTGVVWSLQGSFGRMAEHLINEGVCSPANQEKTYA